MLHSENSRAPSRRTLVKGAAWSVPVVAIAGAAPAVAASAAVQCTHTTTWRWYWKKTPWCGGKKNKKSGLEINTTEFSTGVRFSDTLSTTAITDVYADFWFTRSDLAWSAAPGNSGCWTTPVLTGGTTSWNGMTLYAYRSTFTCPVSPVHQGTTVLPAYRWQSQCYDATEKEWERARWARRTAYATVNGVPQPLDSGFFAIE